MKNIVELTPFVQKKIKKLPHQVIFKLRTWAMQVEMLGIRKVMQTKGYHDEPLQGKSNGQRTIRLNKSYRTFFQILKNGELEVLEVFDVNKHKY